MTTENFKPLKNLLKEHTSNLDKCHFAKKKGGANLRFANAHKGYGFHQAGAVKKDCLPDIM